MHNVFALYNFYRSRPEHHFQLSSREASLSETSGESGLIFHVLDINHMWNMSMNDLCIQHAFFHTIFPTFIRTDTPHASVTRSATQNLRFDGQPDWHRVAHRFGIIAKTTDTESEAFHSLLRCISSFPGLSASLTARGDAFTITNLQSYHTMFSTYEVLHENTLRHALALTKASESKMPINSESGRELIAKTADSPILSSQRTLQQDDSMLSFETRAMECSGIIKQWMHNVNNRQHRPKLIHDVEKMQHYIVRLYNTLKSNRNKRRASSSLRKLRTSIALLESLTLFLNPRQTNEISTSADGKLTITPTKSVSKALRGR